MTFQKLISVIGTCFGAFITFMFGGWDKLLYTAIIFMSVDYITGIIKHFSPKYDKKKGQLESAKGLWGFIKKCLYIVIIFLGYRMDVLLEISLIKDCCCYFFIVNELLSITENFGEMGVPFPDTIKKYIEVLKDKVGE